MAYYFVRVNFNLLSYNNNMIFILSMQKKIEVLRILIFMPRYELCSMTFDFYAVKPAII